MFAIRIPSLKNLPCKQTQPLVLISHIFKKKTMDDHAIMENEFMRIFAHKRLFKKCNIHGKARYFISDIRYSE